MNNDNCCNEEHPLVINQLQTKVLDSSKASYLADFFKVFGDETRLQIINLLSHSEICVCDISSILKMQQSAISHQLKILRHHRLVKTRKVGKQVFYSLDDDHIIEIFKTGLIHINE